MDAGPDPLKVGEPLTPEVSIVSPFLKPVMVAVNGGLAAPKNRLLLSAVTVKCACVMVSVAFTNGVKS
jgi:hypothetical protein